MCACYACVYVFYLVPDDSEGLFHKRKPRGKGIRARVIRVIKVIRARVIRVIWVIGKNFFFFEGDGSGLDAGAAPGV